MSLQATGENGLIIRARLSNKQDVYDVRCLDYKTGTIRPAALGWIYCPRGVIKNSDGVVHDTPQECLDYIA